VVDTTRIPGLDVIDKDGDFVVVGANVTFHNLWTSPIINRVGYVLAGTCDVLGAQHRLSDFFSPGYGYDGIGVALLFTEHPLGVTASAFFFGALRAGLNAVQRNVGLPNALSQVLQGTVILFVVASRGIPRLARRQLGGRKRKRRSESE